jgi:pimeloyl-ACP methyl ester carboxylesterase
MWLIRLLVYGLIGYVIICGFVYLMQAGLLYYPDRTPPSQAQLKSVKLAFWPASGDSFRGHISTGPMPPASGVVVVFHGNAGAAWHRDYYVGPLQGLGYRVVLAEYPVYSGRSGKLSEKSLVADGKETVRLAKREFGGPLYICGESLGAGVAAGVAAEPPVSVAGVVLITPWDSLANLAQTIYWYLPARWLVRDPYDSVQNLTRFGGKIAVALAEHDEIIPNRHGRTLFDALPNIKKLWMIRDATHNTWPSLTGTEWWREVMSFLDQGEEKPVGQKFQIKNHK